MGDSDSSAEMCGALSPLAPAGRIGNFLKGFEI